MRKLCLIASFVFVVGSLKAVTYDHRQVKLKGLNYETKTNILYYTYTSKTVDRVTLLYYLGPEGMYIFKGFEISKSMEARLPLVVVKYIGKYITNRKMIETRSVQQVLSVTKKAIENALDQKWKNNLMAYAQTMAVNPRYHRGNSIIDNNVYYEFIPFHLDAPDTSRMAYIEKPKTINAGFLSGKIKDNLDAIIEALNNFDKHHDNITASDWSWKYKNGQWELDSAANGFHDREIDTCKLKMELHKVDKGEKMPSMCWRQINGATWTKPPTYCNYFAQTLAYLTFGKSGYDPATSPRTQTGWYPWGSEMTANNIHDYMVNHPELFVDLKWQDCWKYINAGYIVYFVWKNPSGAGHIATGYPTEGSLSTIGEKEVGKIVQAGTDGNTDIFQLLEGKPWKSDALDDVKTFLYLGYLDF